jgi:hypothetical protein
MLMYLFKLYMKIEENRSVRLIQCVTMHDWSTDYCLPAAPLALLSRLSIFGLAFLPAPCDNQCLPDP